MRTIAGRTRELERLESFVGEESDGPRGLVLVGEPGMGKTTLWQHAVAAARTGPALVLAARPAEAEAHLSYAALGDLLQPVGLEGLDLPEQLRRPLEIALLRAAPDGQEAGQRAVAAGVAAVLSTLAAERPVLVAIDDVHWADPSSVRVLSFALRRLEQAPVALLLTRRTDRAAGGVERALPADRLALVPLGPLSLAALHVLARDRLGRTLSRLTLVRVEEASGGNPMLALEIGRALADSRPAAGRPIPFAADLLGLARARLARLGPKAHRALLAVAALSRPTGELVERAVPGSGPALARALRAGILEEDGRERLRFSHPVLAAAALSSATAAERRSLHRALAEVVGDAEQRARHLALAAAGADAEVAALLAEAAAAAAARSASEAAVELLELALQLTPVADPAADERELALAEALFRAGETARALTLLRALGARLDPSPLRARVNLLHAVILHEAGGEGIAELCALALADAGDDPALRIRIHATWALADVDDLGAAGEHARAALELLRAVPEPDAALEGLTLLSYVATEFHLGRGIPEAEAQRALELERRTLPTGRIADRFAPALGVFLKYSDRLDEARELLLAALEAAEREHDESSLPFALSHLPQLELWAGNWRLAERYAREHLELSERAGQESQRVQALHNVADVLAYLGRVDDARAVADEGLRLARQNASPWEEAILLAVLGFLDWSLGDARGAVAHLERAAELRAGMQLLDPGYGRTYAELVEALVALGRVDEAAAIVAERERRAEQLERPAALAVALRCRAVIAAARGDAEQGLAYARVALERHAEVELPFEAARTLLVKGRIERRLKQKAAARDSLTRALEAFSGLGAAIWAESAAAELGRIGLRRAAPGGLSSMERRVAELAADGLTNREVAGALFLSVKTVEAHLGRAYRKLGIHSRAQLGARLARGERPVQP